LPFFGRGGGKCPPYRSRVNKKYVLTLNYSLAI